MTDFCKLKTRHTLNAFLFNPVQLKPKDGFLLKLEEVLSDLDSQPNSVSTCLVTMMTMVTVTIRLEQESTNTKHLSESISVSVTSINY